MEQYVLIMRHEDGSKIASPEQMQVWLKQTMDWIGGIAAQNKFVSGTGLPFDEARVVQSSKMVTNGPFGEIKETIGGFIIVKAERTVGHHFARLHHSCFIKGQASATYKFVLRRNSAYPIHRLFHPNLHLLGRSDL